MTNEERMKFLAKARRKSVEYALAAEASPKGFKTEYGNIGSPTTGFTNNVMMAQMWATVANCLKVGGVEAIATDGPDGVPEGVAFADTDRLGRIDGGIAR